MNVEIESFQATKTRVSFPIESIKGSVHDCGPWKTFAY